MGSRAVNKAAGIPIVPGQAYYLRYMHGRSQADQLRDCCPSSALKARRLNAALTSCVTQ